MLFLQLLKLRHYHESDLWDFVRAMYEETKGNLIEHGCLPKIKDNTKLLVVHDEAQVLGDEFDGSFQSTTSTDSPRPLLSPILHAFREIGEHQLSWVTCGTRLSINTFFWVQSSGSGLKDSSTTFKESINTYISRVRDCLHDEQPKLALDECLSQEAVEMPFQKFVGRYRPTIAVVFLERIVECNDASARKKTIKDAEDKLDQLVETIDSMLALLMYQRCMFGDHNLVLKEVDPQLVEHAFGRVNIIQSHAVTEMDEAFAIY
ncbi:hypothetical protein KI688_006467 [Linnemannia hyalina]|uniref:Uncharacterized protein n=1 Tax=Linnemannia hyalina TaxID=64524 RepID=A0A9P7XIY2_9FUNG|nr:hypothetical protein KI688_006467 [Linnemannia hyalina]